MIGAMILDGTLGLLGRSGLYRGPLRRLHRKYIRRQVDRILRSSAAPCTRRAERDFAQLQKHFPPLEEYGYSPQDLWRRATARSLDLLAFFDPYKLPEKVLEVGAGDGMLGVAFQALGCSPMLTDLVDWRCQQAQSVPFEQADKSGKLTLPSNTFDLVYSFNTFEHLADPHLTFQEMVRVTKPGGQIYLHFGPLYPSAWGLHAFRTITVPYPQYLFSDDFVHAKLQELGIRDLGTDRSELQFVNKMRLDQYDQMLAEPSASVTRYERVITDSYIELPLQYPEAFSGRRLCYADLVVSGLKISARKL